MNRLLYRASGYDVVNLWMNLTKVLLVFLFIYQETLFSQLRLKMFEKQHYVFHVNGSDGVPTQTITTEDPVFRIEFLPLTISRRYDKVRLEILGVGQEGQILLPPKAGAKSHAEYLWPERNDGETETSLRQALFSLRDLVDGPLTTGVYKVRFGFVFYRGDQAPVKEGFTENGEDETDHTLTVNYNQKGIDHFGYSSVIRGRSFEVPQVLRPLQFFLTESRSRKTGSNEEWTAWSSEKALKQQQDRFVVQGVAAGRTVEQKGSYVDERGNPHTFDVGVIISDNLPPRSTYQGPQDQFTKQVTIYSEWIFPNRAANTLYFNLSRYVIDPDGTDAAGQPDVRVRRIADLQPTTDFTLRDADDGSGDRWLVPLRDIDQILPNIGDRRDLQVVAADEVNSQPIKISVIKRK